VLRRDPVVEQREDVALVLVGLGEDGCRRGGQIAAGQVVGRGVCLSDQGGLVICGSCSPADEGRGLGRRGGDEGIERAVESFSFEGMPATGD